VRDQVSRLYKTTGKIAGFYILMSKFLGRRREDKRLWKEWQQAFPTFNLLFISSWAQFWFSSFFSSTWSLLHFQRIYQSVHYDFVLYFGARHHHILGLLCIYF
jgi:hypothetical protein